jgi:uncharacterized membrane protein YczE
MRSGQGCQMVYSQTKNPNLSKFWRVLEWKKLVYSVANQNILWTFGTLYGHLAIWYIFLRFGLLCQKNLPTLVQAMYVHIYGILCHFYLILMPQFDNWVCDWKPMY